jgi:hypothetical protein
MLEDLSLLYVFNFVFCLREFNFREKLEEKNESRKKYFEFLSNGAKQKNQGGAKCTCTPSLYYNTAPVRRHANMIASFFSESGTFYV